MEVIVKSSPKIEIELATKVVKVGGKVTVDSALSTTSENPVQNKVITSELSSLGESVVSLEVKKADKDGVYSGMTVGTADDLAGRGESVPAEFGFRASGGKSIKDGRAYIKRIKGNSVVWNQTMEKPYTKFFTNRVTYSIENNVVRCVVNSIAYPFVGIYSDKVEKQHTYLVAFKYLGNKNAYVEGGIELQGQGINIAANKLTQFTAIKKASNTAQVGFVVSTIIESMEIGDTFEVHDINVYDLTKMFQAGNEPTTIEEFNARVATLGVDMNAYNEGQVIHCNTESIKSVGDNAWDEEWESGKYDVNNGSKVKGLDQIRNANLIPVLPNSTYNFSGSFSFVAILEYGKDKTFLRNLGGKKNQVQISADCHYINIYTDSNYGTTYNHDITISLYHSGWKAEVDNTYKPYWQDTLPLPIISKYFPNGMKSAGTAHDEIRYNKASGKWEAVQRIGSVDMGTLNFKYALERFLVKIPTMPTNGGILCAKYSATTESTNAHDKSISNGAYYDYNTIAIKDTSYTDAATFKTEMAGVILYYELAKPIVTELDAEDQNFRDYYQVADFGTEQSQSAVPSAPFSADIIYQFNAVDMIREHELEITDLQKVIATMQAQLTSLINGGQ